MAERSYIAIDLKSFYASVECIERGLDPFSANLVVADASRTDKTICLAVSPALKAYGVPGRPRLFEVVQRIEQVNRERLRSSGKQAFTGESSDAAALAADPGLAVSYLVAPPRMAQYVRYSQYIYSIYLRHIAPEDILVYSIDEVFIDVTPYLHSYRMTPHELAIHIIREVLRETGITATVGIGSNLYLAKIAMDIVAKHVPADRDGVRIAELDEQRYRERLWTHRPLTDFWRVGPGYARKLEAAGLYTMGDIARCSLGAPEDYHNAARLYQLFGVSAELLIDHAWGREPCSIADAKAYQPSTNSVSSGQVLAEPYPIDKTRLIVREMLDALALELTEKRVVTGHIVLRLDYDVENLRNPGIRQSYHGEIARDRYGRQVPKHVQGTAHLQPSNSARTISETGMALFERIANPRLLVRRVTVSAEHLHRQEPGQRPQTEQLTLRMEETAAVETGGQGRDARQQEERIQETILHIRKKYGKNALIRAMDLQEGATALRRNAQIGGHQAEAVAKMGDEEERLSPPSYERKAEARAVARNAAQIRENSSVRKASAASSYREEGVQNTHPYRDILQHPGPKAQVRPPMAMHERAAQFAPFAPLTRYTLPGEEGCAPQDH